MEIRYVKRDEFGKIIGDYANPQPGFAEEPIADNSEELMAFYKPKEPTYADKRAAEYPPIGDQLDALFHAGVFPADMAAQIQAVKDKYPKG